MIKKNIGFLGNQIAPGGGSASLLLMIKSLDSSKFDSFLLSSDCANSSVKEEFSQYCKTVVVDKRISQFVSCAGHPPSRIEYIRAIWDREKQSQIVVDFINRHSIDILHINNAVFSHLYSYIKKNTNVLIISHIREQVHLYGKKRLEDFIISNIETYSEKIICISDKEAEPFSHKHKIVVLANPFDFSVIKDISVSKFRNQYNIGEDTIIIGMMGRFARDKGHLLFLQSARYVLDHYKGNKKLKFLLLGVNQPKPKWKVLLKKVLFREEFREVVLDYIKNNNLVDSVVLHPFVKEVYPIIKEIDIYVRPSLTKDPWGRDIIEAMALKRMVIATGDYEFFVRDGMTGFLVNELNDIDLGRKIVDVVQNDSNEKIVDSAFDYIWNKTNIIKYGIRIEEIYAELWMLKKQVN